MQNIPKHLKKYIVNQDYSQYTPIDQSTWRFIMKISISFFSKNAHGTYLKGLEKTGITLNEIPKINSINKKLQNFGWSAICVRGFIPPNAFMEFQSLKILPIAADMRSHNHLTYTPSPDIVHEAAGHAPIIANRDYSRYLISYGEIASKAIMSAEDMNLYYAIRNLSDIKERSNVSKQKITHYEQELKKAYKNISYLSESSLLSRMNWWTVEYGLVGNIENPKIYGAGLLSSVAESENCLNKDVKKIPFGLKCLNYNYDITEQQPQLFVTPNFKYLTRILKKLSEKMSYKIGGKHGLDTAIRARTVCTIEIDNQIQISGILDSYINKKNKVLFIKTIGPSQLCFKNKEIYGHNLKYHKDGYSSPIGKLRKCNKSISQLSSTEIKNLNLEKNKQVKLYFKSNISVAGKISKIIIRNSKIILITFINCTVKQKNTILFKPKWGNYDMICGEIITSVYGGPADKKNYYLLSDNEDRYLKYNKKNQTQRNIKLNTLHKKIYLLKNKKNSFKQIERIYLNAKKNFSNEWLIFYEILEISLNIKKAYWITSIIKKLNKIIEKNNDLSHAIKRGLDLLLLK